LCRDTYGRHVVTHLLEYGTSAQKSRIASSLLEGDRLLAHSRHRRASYVVEAALERCDIVDRQNLAETLLQNPDKLGDVIATKPGFHVVKTLVMREENRDRAVRLLLPYLEREEGQWRRLRDCVRKAGWVADA